MTRKFFVSSFLLALVFMTQSVVFAAEAPIKLKKGEKLFDQDYDKVWDATVAVIQEIGFSDHPHKKWKTKKEKGRIKTPEWRYFKIWSADPVIDKHYKDSYKIKIKKIDIEVPKPAAAKPEKAPDAGSTEKAPDAAAKPAADAAKAETAESAPPVPTISKIKVSIKRKFLVHNDETRKWDKGDPDKEKAGYSVEDIYQMIEEKLTEQNPAVNPAKQANLNITPPPVHKVPKP